ncbi:nitrilotriacetate monooxygenase component b [Fusarium albosuccineum]|uniref:Nitrilotriacetate monooxygenase component b n=1 Tax=Fusarium albosuccineum TaxID=1237068 RepID=A0A8H4P046_9HYPO|nr:nitrilotriacetate monooxygenase component b [Fusarium albosuccineum]
MGSTIANSGNNKNIRDQDEFEQLSAGRPDFDRSNKPVEITMSPDPSWKYGQGTRVKSPGIGAHKEIDPFASSRPKPDNYHLLISGIAPRPIGFISTRSSDGKTKNLAPFSYFQVVDHDPPLFIVGIGARSGKLKDTFRNLKENGECVINTVSEHMIEAVNATSLDAPYGVSEWDVSGLHEAPTTTVKPSRVEESVFSIEGNVVDIKELTDYATPGMAPSAVVLIRGSRFWVREDAANEEASHIYLDKLRPLAQLGGMAYGRITSTFDVPRKAWVDEEPSNELLQKLGQEASDAR